MQRPGKGRTVPKTIAPAPSIFRLNLTLGGRPVKTVDVKPGCCIDSKPAPKK